jgi:hypothetical protein
MVAAKKLEKIWSPFPTTEPAGEIPRNTIEQAWATTTRRAAKAKARGNGLTLKVLVPNFVSLIGGLVTGKRSLMACVGLVIALLVHPMGGVFRFGTGHSRY